MLYFCSARVKLKNIHVVVCSSMQSGYFHHGPLHEEGNNNEIRDYPFRVLAFTTSLNEFKYKKFSFKMPMWSQKSTDK
jgi:hypothetical protein